MYITLALFIRGFAQSELYYQSMILIDGTTGILISLSPIKSDNDD